MGSMPFNISVSPEDPLPTDEHDFILLVCFASAVGLVLISLLLAQQTGCLRALLGHDVDPDPDYIPSYLTAPPPPPRAQPGRVEICLSNMNCNICPEEAGDSSPSRQKKRVTFA